MKVFLTTALLFHVLVSSVSEAKYFSCVFTEPFFNLYISTQYKMVTYSPAIEGQEKSYTKKITSIKNSSDKTLINDNIVIFNNSPGSNGMSDHLYPFLITYKDESGGIHYGGCDSEAKFYINTISRFASLTGHGYTMANYWPGEYGFLTGFKTKKDVTLSPNTTYSKIESSEPELDNKECKLSKNQMLVPSLAKKGQIYATISKARKFVAIRDSKVETDNYEIKKGDSIYELMYGSEGYCVVEKNGEVGSELCPSISVSEKSKDPLFQEVDEENKPVVSHNDEDPFSEYVFTQCQDGHWTWISSKLMAEHEGFASAHDPKLD